MNWYEVTLEKSTVVRVYAQDAEMARDKAEEEMGDEWCANGAREV